MSASPSRYSQAHLEHNRIHKVTKKLETIQLFGIILNAFICLSGLLLISDAIGIAILILGVLSGFIIYLVTQGFIIIVTVLMQIEMNTRP